MSVFSVGFHFTHAVALRPTGFQNVNITLPVYIGRLHVLLVYLSSVCHVLCFVVCISRQASRPRQFRLLAVPVVYAPKVNVSAKTVPVVTT